MFAINSTAASANLSGQAGIGNYNTDTNTLLRVRNDTGSDDTTNGLCYLNSGLVGINKTSNNINYNLDVGGTINSNALTLNGGPMIVSYHHNNWNSGIGGWRGVRLLNVFTKPANSNADIIVYATLTLWVDTDKVINVYMIVQQNGVSTVAYNSGNVFSRRPGETGTHLPVNFVHKIPSSSLPGGISYDITFNTTESSYTDDNDSISILVCFV